VGFGPHHLFITRDSALSAKAGGFLRSPELLVSQGWKSHLPKGPMREPLGILLAQAAIFLEAHSVNRVRVDLGENPANMIWLWGAAGSEPQKTFTERTRLSGALISSHFPMRGFAQCLGLSWNEGPSSWEELPLKRLATMLFALSKRHDFVYVHLSVESADPVERLCAMERMDQLVLKPLTEQLPTLGQWRLAAVIDDRMPGIVPYVAIGTGLPQQPVTHLDAQQLAQSALAFEDPAAFFAWFTSPLAC
jgi:2,3-bisphosphoglycerate-independent phosphoglycerate mutase